MEVKATTVMRKKVQWKLATMGKKPKPMSDAICMTDRAIVRESMLSVHTRE